MDEVRQYQIQGQTIRLRSSPGVFLPSQHGQFFAEHIGIRPGERVLDVGTGAGILGVYAACCGAEVKATDITPESVRLSEDNARLNGVSLTAAEATFFGHWPGPYDVIMANLPQEIVPPGALAELGSAASAVVGGTRGNDLVTELLARAPAYLATGGRLYIPLHTLSDYQHTLQQALVRYQVRLIAIGDLPAKRFVTDHLEHYQPFMDDGTIRLFCRHEQWYTNVYVLELTLKP